MGEGKYAEERDADLGTDAANIESITLLFSVLQLFVGGAVGGLLQVRQFDRRGSFDRGRAREKADGLLASWIRRVRQWSRLSLRLTKSENRTSYYFLRQG
jgi:hypothetical protein